MASTAENHDGNQHDPPASLLKELIYDFDNEADGREGDRTQEGGELQDPR